MVLLILSPLAYSVVSESIHHDDHQALQASKGELIQETKKKIESEITGISNNNVTTDFLSNPQDSGIILLDYYSCINSVPSPMVSKLVPSH